MIALGTSKSSMQWANLWPLKAQRVPESIQRPRTSLKALVIKNLMNQDEAMLGKQGGAKATEW
jgi:hypothetical protein